MAIGKAKSSGCAPFAEMSVLETGSDHSMHEGVTIRMSERSALLSSISRVSHQQPQRIKRVGQAGPPFDSGLSERGSVVISARGKAAARFGAPRPFAHALLMMKR